MILRAEWAKFRTVPGWVAGVLAGSLIVVALGFLTASGTTMSCMAGTREVACPAPPTDAAGEAVQDEFTFVHRTLVGDGSITAKVGGLSGTITYPPPDHDKIVSGVVPWAKAGLMVKDGTRPGAAYASVLLTGAHGVRMQTGFTHDEAAPYPASEKEAWLRLTRTGETVTGYVSSDGAAWQKIDSVRVAKLPGAAEIGLFVTSPSGYTVDEKPRGGHAVAARFTQATAKFSQVTPPDGWTASVIGRDDFRTDWERTHPPGYHVSDGVFTVAGSGDIGPAADGGMAVETPLMGVYIGLLALIAVAALCGAAEFRHGMIRTTLTAMPYPIRVSAVKAGVVGAVSMVAGLLAVAVTLPVTWRVLTAHHVVITPVPWPTTLRVAFGTALLLSLVAVLAYGLGALLRHAVPVIVAVTALVIAPPILAVTSVLPIEVGAWLLRVTPAAAFAIQQSVPAYPQMSKSQTVADGYFPLSPWAGLGVLACYALVSVAAATWRLRREVAGRAPEPDVADRSPTPGAPDRPRTQGAADWSRTPGVADRPRTPDAEDRPPTSGSAHRQPEPGSADRPRTSGAADRPPGSGAARASWWRAEGRMRGSARPAARWDES